MAVGHEYFKELGKRLWALMSCALFTLVGIYVSAAEKSPQWAAWASGVLALGCFVLANYLAWRDQRDKVRELTVRLGMPQIMLRYAGIEDKYALHRATASPEEMTELTVVNCSELDVFDVCIGRNKFGGFYLASTAPMDRLAKNSERKIIYTVIDSFSNHVSLTHYAALNGLLDSLAD
jgi:hypothetical protein